MNRDTEVDAMFVLDQGTEGGIQFLSKIMQVYKEICGMILSDDGHLLDRALLGI